MGVTPKCLAPAGKTANIQTPSTTEELGAATRRANVTKRRLKLLIPLGPRDLKREMFWCLVTAGKSRCATRVENRLGRFQFQLASADVLIRRARFHNRMMSLMKRRRRSPHCLVCMPVSWSLRRNWDLTDLDL